MRDEDQDQRDKDTGFSEDLLRGAEDIALWLFGDASLRRRIYHLASTSKHFPVFKIGSMLCARKSRLLAWIEMQEEGRPANDNEKPANRRRA